MLLLTGLLAPGVRRLLSVELLCLTIGYVALPGRGPNWHGYFAFVRFSMFGTAQTIMRGVVTLVVDSGNVGVTHSTEHHYAVHAA
jgi:hypothetical protein